MRVSELEPGGDFRVDCEVRLKDIVAQVPGARWRAKLNAWRIPRTFHALIQLYALSGGTAVFQPEVLEALDRFRGEETRVTQARALLQSRGAKPGDDVHSDILFPFQERTLRATEFAMQASAGGALLAAEPGTGKTAMATEWLRDRGPGPHLVVAPVATHSTWLKWANERLPGMFHAALPVSPATIVQRRKVLAAYRSAQAPGVLLVTYSQLPLHSRQAPYGSVRLDEKAKTPKELNDISWVSVVLDEAHRVSNPKAAWSRAAAWLAQHAPARLLMTGTPCKAIPEESMTRLLALAYPEGWPSWTKVSDLYFRREYSFWGGAEITGLEPTTEAEFRRLRDLTSIQLPKSLALPDLQAPVYVNWDVFLTKAQMTQYVDLKREMVTEGSETGEQIAVFSPAVAHIRLGEAAAAKIDVDNDGNVIMKSPSPVIDALLEIREHLATDVPFLVFSASRKLLDLAEDELKKKGAAVAKLVGGMSGPDRDSAIAAYNDQQVDYLLVSLGASADGWSGTGGNVGVFLLRSYKPEENRQAEDRIHGVGRGLPGRPTLIYDVVVKGTVLEERLEHLRGVTERGLEVLA